MTLRGFPFLKNPFNLGVNIVKPHLTNEELVTSQVKQQWLTLSMCLNHDCVQAHEGADFQKFVKEMYENAWTTKFRQLWFREGIPKYGSSVMGFHKQFRGGGESKQRLPLSGNNPKSLVT